jgi:uncharacterized protein with FMN-binding domain
MYENQERKEKLSNVAGILCGLFLVCVLVFSIVSAHTIPTVGVRSGEIPDAAMTVQGTADGRNGPVTVEVVADNENIYQIRVLNEEETEGIGSVAVKQLPKDIFDGQDLNADAVSGATITSEALRNAIVNALKDAGIETKAFGLRTVKLEQVAEQVEEGAGIQVIKSADCITKERTLNFKRQGIELITVLKNKTKSGLFLRPSLCIRNCLNAIFD